MRKLWMLNAGNAKAPIFYQNEIAGSTESATQEGYLWPDSRANGGSGVYAPTNEWFWWCNRNDGGSPIGANIIDVSKGEKLSDYSIGANVKVGVIDFEFMSESEQEIPVQVIARSESVWNDDEGYRELNADPSETKSFKGRNKFGVTNSPWHGREVASLIFAPSSDGCGTLGTAPGALPYLFRTYGSDGSYARAYEQAMAQGCRVINMSIRSPRRSFPLLEQAIERGMGNIPSVIAVASAGNSGDEDVYPAGYAYVISASATRQDGKKAVFTKSTMLPANSKNVDIWAPGVDIAVGAYPGDSLSKYPGSPSPPRPEQFYHNEGTSYSAPIVAGVVACLLEKGYAEDYISAVRHLKKYGQVNNDVNGVSLDAINSLKPQGLLRAYSGNTPASTPTPTFPPSAPPTPTPAPSLSPTPIPTPKPTPRLSRFYAATRWTNRSRVGESGDSGIYGVAVTMRHVPLTSRDKTIGGVAGEALWAVVKPDNWVELGYADGPTASRTINGRCFYWAEANSDLGQYQDYRVSNDTDVTGDVRSYRISPRLEFRGSSWLVRTGVFLSEKNAGVDVWKLVGISRMFFNQPFLSTDHGLEVTSKTPGTILFGQQARIEKIMHAFWPPGEWWNVDGISYQVENITTALPQFGVTHDLADLQPTNNITINYEVP